MSNIARQLKTASAFVFIAFFAVVGASCGSDEVALNTKTAAEPTLSPTATQAPVATATLISTLTVTLTPTATITPAPAATLTPTATATQTSVPTATSTATPTLTPTPKPPNARAEAGQDRNVERGETITLNGSGSTDPDGDPIVSYRWKQVYGQDVTGGVGVFVGATPLITAPDSVGTVILELRVNDGHGDGEPDRIQINIWEHSDTGFFVDGDRGSDDDRDGSRENPFASISYALNQIQGPNYDIYVKSRSGDQAYVESETLSPQTTISLYGGYGEDWIRDVVGNRTKLRGAPIAVDFRTVFDEAWFSGFELTSANAEKPGDDSVGVRGTGDNSLFIEDNIITAGNGAAPNGQAQAGSSYGVSVNGLTNAVIRRNVITSGNGRAGNTGSKGGDGKPATTNGSNGSGGNGGAGGKGGASSLNGGNGGNGGAGLIPQDGKAGGGAGGGIGDKVGAGRVGDGGGGAGGNGGNGGTGGAGPGSVGSNGNYVPAFSAGGVSAGNGAGGGGGGGGAGGVGLTGGGGGGAGGGGQGGVGGSGGVGGGASIGVLVFQVESPVIEDNEITAQSGGRGGNGGAGGIGGKGTKGGVGAPNVCSFLGCDVGRSGDGGEGGGGGSGGIGGQGGGGAGGPSFGILVGANSAPMIRDNVIAAGNGANGGIGGAAGLGGSPGGGGGSTGGSGGCCSFLLQAAGSPGTGGQGGYSYAIFDLDTNDNATPALNGNQLTVGTPGGGGAINGAPGESGETNF